MEPTVLLVDDEEDIRDVLEVSLRDLGYRVRSAANGESALQTFHEIHPPIVLTDIKMPGMDGIELLRRIKGENPEAEVVMITGHGDMDLAIKSLKFEATDFITKPINVEALEISLKRVRDRITLREKLREYTESLEALVKEKTDLQDHLATLGLMIGSISHGIKGLLTGLDGGVYLVDSGFAKKDDLQIREGWQVVKMMVDRIRKMIQDILFYAKKRDLKRERVGVGQFAEEVAKGLEPRASGAGIDLVRDFEKDLGEMSVDPSYIQSALLNIFENAVDACLKEASGRPRKITFSVRGNPDEVDFEIADNGVGMEREVRDKLFTLFFSSKGEKGTGLGLFITHKIVQQHGGAIQVKSTPGVGSAFRLRIPRQPDGLAGEPLFPVRATP